MVYDFVAKIKGIQNKEYLNQEYLSSIANGIKAKTAFELKFILPNADCLGEVLVKSQTSVASLPGIHDKELDTAVASFISYLEELASAVEGEVSRQDGFYNNTKTFKRLFS